MQSWRAQFLRMLPLCPVPALVFLGVSLLWFAAIASDRGLVYSGMLQVDQPTYTALARAVTHRGNGFFYPNPFDSDPAAPCRLFNAGYALLGWLIRLCGDNAIVAWEIWRIAWGAAAAALWALLAFRLVRGRTLRWSMWFTGLCGGGIAWLPTLARVLRPGSEGWLKAFQAVEASYGGWCLNFFRQGIYPLELCYHALLFGALLLYLARRRRGLAVLVAVLWATHPITALLTTCIVGAACTAEVLFPLRRSERSANLALACALFSIAALATLFYRVYLPGFPSIANWIHQTLAFQPHLAWRDYFPAYGVLLLAPAVALGLPRLRRWLLRTHPGRLVMAWGVMAWFWPNNDLFLRHPIQPLHFMRGHLYLWLLVVLAKALDLHRATLRRRLFCTARRVRFAALLSLLLFVPDNAMFVVSVATEFPQLRILLYSAESAQVQDYFAKLPDANAACIHCSDTWLSVNLVMQGRRVYVSEQYMTPYFLQKVDAFHRLDRLGDVIAMRSRLGITHLVYSINDPAPAWLGRGDLLRLAYQNAEFHVYELLPAQAAAALPVGENR